jgi:hypothetical protein
VGLFDRFRKSSKDGTPPITEEPIDAETLGNIQGCASEAAKMLGLDRSKATPAELVKAVDEFVYNWQKGARPAVDPEDDLSLTLGSLWGEQLVKSLRWEWTGVTFHEHGGTYAVGVVSPDRSLAIYPFHFIYGCMENNATITIMLSYKMLVDATRVPKLPAGGFENVMDNVHHIIPRD